MEREDRVKAFEEVVYKAELLIKNKKESKK